MAANEQLLVDVLEVAAELGSVPCVICGDFNVEPDMSPTIRNAVLTGRWVDVAAAFGNEEKTCFKNTLSL
eukprot:8311786-Karenia_brevis.AAC.1